MREMTARIDDEVENIYLVIFEPQSIRWQHMQGNNAFVTIQPFCAPDNKEVSVRFSAMPMLHCTLIQGHCQLQSTTDKFKATCSSVPRDPVFQSSHYAKNSQT